MKKIKNQPLVNPFNGNTIEVTIRGASDTDTVKRDLSTAMAIHQFLANGFVPQFDANGRRQDEALTITDSHHAIRVLDVLRPYKLFDAAMVGDPPKVITFEDADHEWLMRQFEKRGALLYGLMSEVYKDAFAAVEKLEEPPKKTTEEEVEAHKPRLVSARK